MSTASFSIDVDPPRELVRIRMSGFFNIDDITRFENELRLAHQQLGCARKKGPLTINDLSGMAIQSQDIVARWSAFLANPAYRSRRLAFVVGSALARIQLLRVIGERDALVFTDAAAAEHWLFQDQASSAN